MLSRRGVTFLNLREGLVVLFLAPVLYSAPVKSNNLITFQGVVVEPGCELKVNAVRCPVFINSTYTEHEVRYSVEPLGLSVGQSRNLFEDYNKIDSVQVVRIDENKVLVTANHS